MIPEGSAKVKMGLVLSGGRTGTTLLHELLSSANTGHLIFQEPHPSRSIHLMANADDRGIPLRPLALSIFLYTRRKWAQHGRILEINPFLCGIAKLFKPEMGIASVVHLVRHPYHWINSMILFRGYGWRRRITPYVPFFYGKPAMAKSQWGSLSEPERLAWNWLEINRNIMHVAESGIPCLTIRFEDFVDSNVIKSQTLIHIAAHLGLDPECLGDVTDQKIDKVNPSPKSNRTSWENWHPELCNRIWDIVSPLARSFGYSSDGKIADHPVSSVHPKSP